MLPHDCRTQDIDVNLTEHRFANFTPSEWHNRNIAWVQRSYTYYYKPKVYQFGKILFGPPRIRTTRFYL